MPLNSFEGNDQGIRYRLIGMPFRQQSQDFHFASSDRIERSIEVAGRQAIFEFVESSARKRAPEEEQIEFAFFDRDWMTSTIQKACAEAGRRHRLRYEYTRSVTCLAQIWF